MKDRRSQTPQNPEQIPEDLALNAKQQLEREIGIMENWLKGLEETRDDNSESIIARKSYTEMLQNRQELLNTLFEPTTES